MLPIRNFGLGSRRVSCRAWFLAGVSVVAMAPLGVAARPLGGGPQFAAPTIAANAAAAADRRS
jgi:hypothetical protein